MAEKETNSRPCLLCQTHLTAQCVLKWTKAGSGSRGIDGQQVTVFTAVCRLTWELLCPAEPLDLLYLSVVSHLNGSGELRQLDCCHIY